MNVTNPPYALRMGPDDNVAVALREIPAGAPLGIEGVDVVPKTTIPVGHKLAIVDIPAGALVRKYGQTIGRSSAAIAAGEHAHIHNVEGIRGRGDLASPKVEG